MAMGEYMRHSPSLHESTAVRQDACGDPIRTCHLSVNGHYGKSCTQRKVSRAPAALVGIDGRTSPVP